MNRFIAILVSYSHIGILRFTKWKPKKKSSRVVRNLTCMRRMTLYILLGIIISITIAGIAFLHQPSFGRLPKGERLEHIKRSPNYREGEFRNIDTTILMTSHKSRLSGIWSFLFRKVEGLRPDDQTAWPLKFYSVLTKELPLHFLPQSMPPLFL